MENLWPLSPTVQICLLQEVGQPWGYGLEYCSCTVTEAGAGCQEVPGCWEGVQVGLKGGGRGVGE